MADFSSTFHTAEYIKYTVVHEHYSLSTITSANLN